MAHDSTEDAHPVTVLLDLLGFEAEERVAVCRERLPDEAFTAGVVSVAEAGEVVEEHTTGRDVWISANPISADVERGRGRWEDVTALRNVWADLDVKPGGLPSWEAARGVVDDLSTMLGTAPTVVVMSGHGLQPRWALEDDPASFDPVPAQALLDRFAVLVRRVARAHGGDVDATFDLSRVLRAPGTVNFKSDPVSVALEEPGGYTLDRDALEAALDEYAVPDAEPREAEVEVAFTTEDEYGRLDETLAGRVDRFVETATSRIAAELRSSGAWPDGHREVDGREEVGWEKYQANRAARLGALARAPWNRLTMSDARSIFLEAAPTDASWTTREVVAKFDAQCERFTPAVFPPSLRQERDAGIAFAPDHWPMRSWDDFGNAQRLLDHYPGRLLWVDEAEKWAAYDGQRWVLDNTRAAHRLAHSTIEELTTTEARSYDDPEPFLKYAKGLRYVSAVRAMLEATRAQPGLAVGLTEFDADPLLLNVQNGTLDLKTGELLPHDPAMRCMRQAPVTYDPAAACPKWLAFLRKMQPSPDVRAYLQRILGYSITGSIEEQKLFLHLGEGANGKSVMLEVLTGVLGGYGQAIPRTTLVQTRGDAVPTDVARMAGARFMHASESGKGRVLDEETVKGLTGGETQSARFMRQDFFDFTPTGKIHYVTNHFPNVSDAPSTWRRLSVIRWPVVIEDDDPERDRRLASKIVAEEAEGILAWLVEGCRLWQEDGQLVEPALVRAWTASYRAESDEFGPFEEECLVTGRGVGFSSTQSLYDAYSAWCFRTGVGRPMTLKSFSTALRERGYEDGGRQSPAPGAHRVRGFVGVAPKPARTDFAPNL